MTIHKFIRHSFTALLFAIVLTTGTAVVVNQTHEAQAQTSNCSGNTLSIDNMSATTNPLPLAPGSHQLSVSAYPPLAPTIQSVQFMMSTTGGTPSPIGRGMQSGTYYWTMPWHTQITPPGVYNITAVLSTSGGTTCTLSYSSQVAINTTSSGAVTLGLQSVPLMFEGLTNEPRDFTLTSSITSGSTAGLDVTAWTVYKKIPTNLGVISPQDSTNLFHFSSGTVPGTSTITVTAYYGGVSRVVSIPVKVLAQTVVNAQPPNSTSTTTNTSTSGTNTTSTSGQTATPSSTSATTITAPASSPISVESDPPVKNCVLSKLTAERYQEINSGQSRVTAAEFELLRSCFAIRNYVLPSSLVPVATNKINETPVSSDVKVIAITNPIDKSKTASKQVLKFSGHSKPNTTVLLYVFSEPLVLSTSTDANGDWNYSLEDPMQPGKHEVYALVNKGDGNYERSSVFSFAIAKAEAASANPNGYSLNLERNQATAAVDNYATKLYIWAVILLIVVVLATFVGIYARRRKRQRSASNSAVLNNKSADENDIVVRAEAYPDPEIPSPSQVISSTTPSDISTQTTSSQTTPDLETDDNGTPKQTT